MLQLRSCLTQLDRNQFAELTFIFGTKKSFFWSSVLFEFLFLFTHTSSLAAEVERARKRNECSIPAPCTPPPPCCSHLPVPAVTLLPLILSISSPVLLSTFFPSSFPPSGCAELSLIGSATSQVPSYPSVQYEAALANCMLHFSHIKSEVSATDGGQWEGKHSSLWKWHEIKKRNKNKGMLWGRGIHIYYNLQLHWKKKTPAILLYLLLEVR